MSRYYISVLIFDILCYLFTFVCICLPCVKLVLGRINWDMGNVLNLTRNLYSACQLCVTISFDCALQKIREIVVLVVPKTYGYREFHSEIIGIIVCDTMINFRHSMHSINVRET